MSRATSQRRAGVACRIMLKAEHAAAMSLTTRARPATENMSSKLYTAGITNKSLDRLLQMRGILVRACACVCVRACSMARTPYPRMWNSACRHCTAQIWTSRRPDNTSRIA